MSDPRGVLLDRIISEINDLRRRVEAQEAQEQTPRAQKARALDTQFPDALLHLPFDGGVPYERDFSVNLYGHKLQRPTVATGGIIGRPGKFGKAVQCAESTTNLVTNPVFDSLSGWGTRGSPSVRELSTEWMAYGQYSCHIVGTDLGHGTLSFIGTLTSGVTYTASADVKVVSGTARLQVYQDGSPFTSYGYLDVPAPYEGRVSFTFTMPVTTACRVAVNNNGEGYWDGIQVEQKAYPTPLCYGDMGPGHAWTGTPHASTSTRAQASLQYSPVGSLPKEQGSVSLWAKVVANPVTTRYAFYHFAANSRVYIQHSNGEWLGALATTFQPVGTGAPVNYGQWDHLVLTWDGSQGILYVNGIPTTPFAYAGLSAFSSIRVGHGGSSSQELNGYLDDLLILDRALTATEVKRLYEAGQAGLGVLCPPQWKVDDSGAADAHVVATDANGDATVVDLTATGGLNLGTATGAGTGDIRASGTISCPRTRTIFLPVVSCTGGAPPDSYQGFPLSNGATHRAFGFVAVPADFGSAMSITPILVEGGGVAGNARLASWCYYATVGEGAAIHSVNRTDSVAFTAGSTIIAGPSLSLPLAALGDHIGIQTIRYGADALDTYTGVVYIRGWLLTYTATM
jgi:hypothetical protein